MNKFSFYKKLETIYFIVKEFLKVKARFFSTNICLKIYFHCEKIHDVSIELTRVSTFKKAKFKKKIVRMC